MIAACDAALAGQAKEIKIRDLRIQEDEKAVQALQADLADLAKEHAKGTPWYKSPMLWFVVGIGTSAYLIKR